MATLSLFWETLSIDTKSMVVEVNVVMEVTKVVEITRKPVRKKANLKGQTRNLAQRRGLIFLVVL